MDRGAPVEKPGKEARKRLDSQRRATRALSPAAAGGEREKPYRRMRKAHDRCNERHGPFPACGWGAATQSGLTARVAMKQGMFIPCSRPAPLVSS